jgi:hypothetical protein
MNNDNSLAVRRRTIELVLMMRLDEIVGNQHFDRLVTEMANGPFATDEKILTLTAKATDAQQLLTVLD